MTNAVPGANRVAANVEAAIQVVNDIHQSDGIHIKHRGGIGIVAHLRADRR